MAINGFLDKQNFLRNLQENKPKMDAKVKFPLPATTDLNAIASQTQISSFPQVKLVEAPSKTNSDRLCGGCNSFQEFQSYRCYRSQHITGASKVQPESENQLPEARTSWNLEQLTKRERRSQLPRRAKLCLVWGQRKGQEDGKQN